jgi:hypothetical protein
MGVSRGADGVVSNRDPVIQYHCLAVRDQLWTYVPYDDHQWHMIHNLGDPTKCLDVPGASTNPGIQLIVYDCHGGDNQLWTAEGSSVTNCFILKNKKSGQLVGVANSDLNDGAPIVQWPWAGKSDQTWC